MSPTSYTNKPKRKPTPPKKSPGLRPAPMPRFPKKKDPKRKR